MKNPNASRRVGKNGLSVETLEPRCLLSAAIISHIPTQTLTTSQGTQALTLGQFFHDASIPSGDTVVNIQTSVGNIPMYLTDAATPQTVQNFLSYITSGEYANTIIHRSVPGFIIQGGGYTTDGTHITTFGTVPGESGTAVLKNTTGTIAMALTGSPSAPAPNSGTSEWFINLADNPSLDDSSDGGPFTAFGKTIYNGLSVVNAIAALPIVNDGAQQAAWTTVPVQSGTNGATVASEPASNLVTINPVIVPSGLNYSITSSDPNIITGSVSGDTLSLTPVGGGGTAMMTVTATDLGGKSVHSSFVVDVASNSPIGVIGAGGAKSIAYTDPNGTTASIALKGPGTATVTVTGTNIGQFTSSKHVTNFTGTGLVIASIATTGTTSASSLTITTKGGTNAITIGSVSTDALKSVMAKSVTLAGNFASTTSIGTVMLAAVDGGQFSAGAVSSLKINGDFSDALSLNGGGTSLGSAKIGSISGGTWTVSGSAGALTVSGSVGGWSPTFAGAVKSLTIKGTLGSSNVNFSGGGTDIATVKVSGAITGSVIAAVGNLGNVSAASLQNSTIDAGVSSLLAPNVLPVSESEFAAADSIASVKLEKGSNAFSNSYIAAENLGTLALGSLQVANNGTPDGVAASSIKSITAIANKALSLHNQTAASDVGAELTKLGVSLGDFVIQLV